MITHIRVKNFKSWKDSGDVKLEPLTGFFRDEQFWKKQLVANAIDNAIREENGELVVQYFHYGLGQFLPVLALYYYAPEGSILILEQPGIHLHPKV